jgi:hypothetical protein
VSTHPLHVDLFITGARPGATQPVEVAPLEDDSYLVLHSPGFVEGIAAGDVIRIIDRKLGRFEIVTRGGNISVKFAASSSIAAMVPVISAELEALGGHLDGAIENAAVWTIPLASGFDSIESVMAIAVRRMPASEWWYGNVYDEDGQPLRWWESRASHQC